jgi:hypothetical protein
MEASAIKSGLDSPSRYPEDFRHLSNGKGLGVMKYHRFAIRKWEIGDSPFDGAD